MKTVFLFVAVLFLALPTQAAVCCSTKFHNDCVAHGYKGCGFDGSAFYCTNHPNARIAWLLKPDGTTTAVRVRPGYLVSVDEKFRPALVPYDPSKPQEMDRIKKQGEPRMPDSPEQTQKEGEAKPAKPPK